MITTLLCCTLFLFPLTSVTTHAQEVTTHQQPTNSKQSKMSDPLPRVDKKRTHSPLSNFSLSDIENPDSTLLPYTLAPIRTVTILIAADEEYRTAHPDWKTITAQMVEKADNSFWAEHTINFIVTGYAIWKSDGSTNGAILSDLNAEWGNNTQYDFVIGFTKDSHFTAGGIAYVYPSAPQSGISVVLDQGTTYTPYAIQHEWSHNYGLFHDASGSGIVCMMNYDYAYSVNYWDAAHDAQIESHRTWYGF